MEGASLAGLVEVIHLRVAVFPAEMDRVSGLRPGEVLVEMAGNIVASGRRGYAQRIEAAAPGGEADAGAGGGDEEVRRAGERGRRHTVLSPNPIAVEVRVLVVKT